MSTLPVIRTSSALTPRDARGLDHALSGLRANTAVELAVIDATGEKFEAVLDVNTALTRHAMNSTVQIAQMEALGAQMAPQAAPRLAYLADQHAVQAADILAKAHNKLGRLA